MLAISKQNDMNPSEIMDSIMGQIKLGYLRGSSNKNKCSLPIECKCPVLF